MSVDETPDYDRTIDCNRTKHSITGLKTEITELRTDINDLKNDIAESKNDFSDQSLDKFADLSIHKAPVTPGSKRINPFVRDEEAMKGELMVDPLGAIPVENCVTSSQKSDVLTNGDISHDGHTGKYFRYNLNDNIHVVKLYERQNIDTINTGHKYWPLAGLP